MEFLNIVKQMSLMDIVILSMLDMGLNPTEIASKGVVSRKTIYDTKKRNKALLELLKGQK